MNDSLIIVSKHLQDAVLYKSHMHAMNKKSDSGDLKSADPTSFVVYQHTPNLSLPNNICQTSLQYWPWIWRWTTHQLSLIFSSFRKQRKETYSLHN